MAEQADRRRCERASLDARIEFRRRKEMRFAIRLRDLTAEGCRIELPERLGTDELVWISLPGLESLASTVRWACESFSGVEFQRPMHPAVFGMMVGRLQQPQA